MFTRFREFYLVLNFKHQILIYNNNNKNNQKKSNNTVLGVPGNLAFKECWEWMGI